MIRRLKQLLHAGIDSDHVRIDSVYVCPQNVNLLVLKSQLPVHVLCLVFCRLDDICHVFELLILSLNEILLDLDDPSIVKVSRLIEFTIPASHQPLSLHIIVLLGSIILNSLVLVDYFVIHVRLELFDFLDSLCHFPLAHRWVSAGLVLVFIGQFVEVLN